VTEAILGLLVEAVRLSGSMTLDPATGVNMSIVGVILCDGNIELFKSIVGSSDDERNASLSAGMVLVSLGGNVSNEVLDKLIMDVSIADSVVSVVVAHMLLVVSKTSIVEELEGGLEVEALHLPLTSMSAPFETVGFCAGKVNVHSFSSLMLLTPRRDNRRYARA
jgi:hypothetical protein